MKLRTQKDCLIALHNGYTLMNIHTKGEITINEQGYQVNSRKTKNGKPYSFKNPQYFVILGGGMGYYIPTLMNKIMFWLSSKVL